MNKIFKNILAILIGIFVCIYIAKFGLLFIGLLIAWAVGRIILYFLIKE